MVDEGHRLRGHHVVFRDGEQRGLLEGQTPLNGAQDEQLGPRLLQKCDLKKIDLKNFFIFAILCRYSTWSRKGRLAKEVKFLVHLTAMKSNRAQIS